MLNIYVCGNTFFLFCNNSKIYRLITAVAFSVTHTNYMIDYPGSKKENRIDCRWENSNKFDRVTII